ncbi:MAG: hypothetical protein OHK003_19530 [Anaerolineales bacterium]
MKNCFVVGCARSGTSILGELIASHPDVKYIFEAHSTWEMGGLGVNDSHRLTSEYATDEVKSKIRKWFQEQAGNEGLLVEKKPRNILRIPFVREIFPEAKIIHIIRDGRDVACSMIPGCGGEEWNHLKPPTWRQYFDNYKGGIRCGYAWREIVEIGLSDLQNTDHLQIRYEDLLANPISTAEKIFQYLGLNFHDNVAAFCERISNDTNFSYHAKNQEQWYRQNHRNRVGRWRENLTEQEQVTLTNILSPLLSRLGYPIFEEE